MKVPQKGCVLCASTWGNYWEEIEGQKMFFCCKVCADQFKNMLAEISKRTGWKQIDEIRIEGDHRGRICVATSGTNEYEFFIKFGVAGVIQTFVDLPSK